MSTDRTLLSVAKPALHRMSAEGIEGLAVLQVITPSDPAQVDIAANREAEGTDGKEQRQRVLSWFGASVAVPGSGRLTPRRRAARGGTLDRSVACGSPPPTATTR